jgi:pilus assembly protein Flp/PilA
LLYVWTWMQTLGARLRHRDEGATMVEYGLMIALLALVIAAIVTTLQVALTGAFSDVASTLGG